MPVNQAVSRCRLVFLPHPDLTVGVPTAPPQLNIELLPSFAPRPKATHVVFDFDGTLSWIRHGWPEMMQTVMGPRFPLQANETAEDIREPVSYTHLTLPTIYSV